MDNIDTVFFDMGNTLLDFHRGPTDDEKELVGLGYMAEYLNLRFPAAQITVQELKESFLDPWLNFVTPERKKHLKEYSLENYLVPFLLKKDVRLTKIQLIDAIEQQTLEYRKHLWMEPGLDLTLKKIKDSGFKIGVISNCMVYGQVYKKHFIHMGLDPFIDSYTFSYDIVHRKPKSEIFQHALKSLNTSPHQSVMIGDSLEADMAGSSRLGMKTIWYNRKHNLHKSSCFIDAEVCKLSEVLPILGC